MNAFKKTSLLVANIGFLALFAYVNQSGDVATVTANSGQEALVTAPNIDEHSGVILINPATNSDLVGDSVQVN